MQEAYNPPGRSRQPGRDERGDHGSRVDPPLALAFAAGALGDAHGLFDGVREMLAALASAGYPLAMITGGGQAGSAWRASLPAGMLEVAQPTCESQESAASRAVSEAAARLGVDRASIAFVGASPGEVTAARASGVAAALALWATEPSGPGDRPAGPEDADRADWTLHRPADLTRRFARWC